MASSSVVRNHEAPHGSIQIRSSRDRPILHAMMSRTASTARRTILRPHFTPIFNDTMRNGHSASTIHNSHSFSRGVTSASARHGPIDVVVTPPHGMMRDASVHLATTRLCHKYRRDESNERHPRLLPRHPSVAPALSVRCSNEHKNNRGRTRHDRLNDRRSGECRRSRMNCIPW